MKTFILDTNVLLHNSSALFSFGANRVVIPITLIEELDKFKSYSDEVGRHARQTSRFLDELRLRGKLSAGVHLDNGGVLQVVLGAKGDLPPGMNENEGDNKILVTALAERLRAPDVPVIFVSKDLNARIKAEALDIPAEDFESNRVNIDELYTGYVRLELSPRQIATLQEKGECAYEGDEILHANEFIIIEEGPSLEHGIYGRWDSKKGKIVSVRDAGLAPWGIEPVNTLQVYALDILHDPKIQFVTLCGMAGTGKTLLALAAGLQQTVDDRVYRRILVTRPIMPLGRDIGYLPGTKEEKLHQWMGPIFDNLEYIFLNYLDDEDRAEQQLNHLFESKKIELEAATYIRGRSIPNQYMIVDEAQNLTPHEVKTIVSRAGEGTKVVLTGDPYQIDSPYLDSSSNGLTYAVERFKGQPIFGHISLERSERSDLSSLAAKLL